MLKIFENIREWRAQKVAIEALRRMDDRMLNDIGIRREDIPKYVRGLK